MARCLREQPPGNEHGAGEFLPPIPLDASEFRIPKFAVKRSVVGDQGMATDKVGYFTHDVGGQRRLTYHGGGNPGQFFDVRWNAHPSIHQALVAVDDLAILQEYGGNLGGAVTQGG